MKSKVLSLMMVALFSCKGQQPVIKTVNAEGAVGFNSVSIILKILEDTAYVLNKSFLPAGGSTVKLNQVTITYTKDNYYLQQSLDSVIASPKGLAASTLKLIRINWPENLSLDNSMVLVKFHSKVSNSHNIIMADDCIENTIMQLKQNVLVKQTRACQQ